MFRSILLGVGIMGSLFGQIHEIRSIDEVPPFIEVEGKTLCIFDIDYTLIMPENPAGHLPNIIKHIGHYKNVYSDLTHDEGNRVRMRLVGGGNSVIIEDHSPAFIQELNGRGVHVMGFTAGARYHGANGDWRADDLRKIGFDFESRCDLIAPSSDFYHRGVLYGNFEKLKGPTLGKFLQDAHIKPSVVVAVDDKAIHLESMEKELADLDISFIGLNYKGAIDFETKEVSFEEFKAHFNSLRQSIGK